MINFNFYNQENLGRFKHEHMMSIWKDYDVDLHNWLLRLTEEFDLTFPLPKDEINIVPCLLPQEEPKEVWTDFRFFNNSYVIKLSIWCLSYTP